MKDIGQAIYVLGIHITWARKKKEYYRLTNIDILKKF